MIITFIIPLYNEEKTIVEIINSIFNLRIKNFEILVINDCSTDNSIKLVKRNFKTKKNLKILSNSTNQGKGYCIRKGIKESRGDIIAIQDADLEYDPSEYLKMFPLIASNTADVVFGSRFLSSGARRVLYFHHKLANIILTFLSNIITNIDLTDMETCHKCFRADIIKNIKLIENRFGFEPEVTIKLSKVKNIRIYEVPISYKGRTYEEGKKIKLKDAVRALYCIFKYGIFHTSK